VLVLALVALAVLAVPLTGGRLSALASLRWRHAWLLPLALGTQVVVLEVPSLPTTAAAAAHVLTYGLAAAFVVVNRSVRGLWLVAVGAAANGVPIALNGGTLPASPAAMAAAGIEVDGGFTNSGPVEGARLPWLGDVFAVPEPFPLANVFSVGDVLIVAGAVWVLMAATRVRQPAADGAPASGPGRATATIAG
jgi:hypothetical protein